MKGKPFPKPLPMLKLLGPSFIILALGLGSGEIILWPFLVSHWGLGIAWGALLGITFQYFMNMEIERYALVKGESVFVGLKKMFSWTPWWFILSTFIGFGLPGIIAASAKVAAHLVGFTDHKWIAILFLFLIGAILTAGKTVYDMMERLTKTILLIGTPFVFLLAVALTKPEHIASLVQGLMGIGHGIATQPEGYFLLPVGISLATFLGAFAYAGAGGNLNLTQSIYVKEKGYGMGAYAQKMSGLFTSKKNENVKLEGTPMRTDATSIARFHSWWNAISKEHAIVFWFMGLFTMCMLMLLSYSTAYGQVDAQKADISFVIIEGAQIGTALGPLFGILFLAAVVIMLFQTQLGIFDSTSRIMAENLALKKLGNKHAGTINLSRIYYAFLWGQIIFGSILFLIDFKEPLQLLVLAAVLNAVSMFVHVGLVNWMNHNVLPKQVQAALWRKAIIVLIFLFFGLFSILTIQAQVSQFLK